MNGASRLVWCLLPIAVIATGLLLLRSPCGDGLSPADAGNPDILEVEEDGYLYTYCLITGSEALFERRTDPSLLRNLFSSKAGLGLRLRHILEQTLGVRDLESLRREHRRKIDDLTALGYL